MKKPTLFFRGSFHRVMPFLVMTAIAFLSGNLVCGQERRTDISASADWVASECEKIKLEIRQQQQRMPAKAEANAKLLQEINIFRGRNQSLMSRQENRKWDEQLQLSELRQGLQQENEDVDIEFLDEILDALREEDTKRSLSQFVRFRNALENKRQWLVRQKQASQPEEMEAFLDSLSGLIRGFMESPDVGSAEVVLQAMARLEEMGCGKDLTTFLQKRLIRPNLRLQVRSGMMEPFFQRNLDEPVGVEENVLGTYVRGSGQLDGKVKASFVPSNDSATIRVSLAGELNTSTVGTNGPVRVHSNNRTEISTVKDIVIGKESIATTLARTDANQWSQIANVTYTRRGPLVQMVAPNQIRQRKPASDAESERLTKRRFNSRVDTEVDRQVAGFNDIMQKLVNGNGRQDGLRLRFENIRTTENALFAEAVAGSRTQPAAWSAPPTVMTNAGLLLQLHESVPNNAGDCELSGETLIEEQIVVKLQERFPAIMENSQTGGNGEEPMLVIEFSDTPVRMTFDGNHIGAVIETTAIEREGHHYAGMTLEFRFRIETTEDGFQLVSDGSPEVLPLGFDKENDLLSARETTIRAIIMKKLDRVFEKPIDWTESVIEGKNGTLTLKPVHLSTVDGWLSLGLDLVEWQPNQTATAILEL